MTDPTPLQAPAAEAVLTLTPPPPVQPVAATQAPRMAPAVDPTMLPGLDEKIDSYVSSLLAAKPHSPEFAAKAADVRSMGDADIRKAAETSNRLLRTPVKALRDGGLSQGSRVSGTLLELRRTIEDLDPKGAQGTKKLLGLLPFGDKITDYFRKYQSSQAHLDAILHALYDGQDELRKDNQALNQEKQNLWDAMARLNQYVYIAERLDARLAAKMAELEAELLRDNSVLIQQQAASSTIGLPQLQAAFQNVYATMDAIDSFKAQALDSMAATIGTLENEVAKSREYLERVSRHDERVAGGSLDLGAVH